MMQVPKKNFKNADRSSSSFPFSLFFCDNHKAKMTAYCKKTDGLKDS